MKYKNRYGNEYWFKKISENLYSIDGNLDWWRFGGNEGEQFVDMNNLGFADPSGGPFIAKGYVFKVDNGDSVDKFSTQKISNVGGKIVLEVIPC